MDIGAFAEDDFDPKVWINKVFKSSESAENKDVVANVLVKKLQVYSEQVGIALEDASEKVLQSLPRIIRDSEILHQEALLLRDKMHTVKAEIAKAEKDTGQSMAALEQVDRIKTELQAARQALREADNWTMLANDIEDKFENGDLEGASKTLQSMQQSLQILSHVPDIEEKRLQLEGLKNRLEATASPLLVHAFTSENIDEAKRLVKIFTDIERLSQLIKYHHKCQEKVLLQKLKETIESDTEENPAEFMRRIYDLINICWNEQIKWCTQVFSPKITPLKILLPLFADLLIGIEPYLSSCIGSCLNLSDPLSALIDLRQITKQAADVLQNSIEQLQQSSSEIPDPDMVLALAQATHAPWVIAVQRYGELEKPILEIHITTIISGDELPDKIQSLSQSCTRVSEVIKLSITRCVKLTEFCGAVGLIDALEDYIKLFCCQFKIILEELSKMKSDEEDWSLFQYCLTLLQASGDLISQIFDVENIIKNNLKQLNFKASPFSQHDELLLTPEGRKKLQELIYIADHGGSDNSCVESVIDECKKLCKETEKTASIVIFSPIADHLLAIQCSDSWNNTSIPSDLPDFSYTPHEYITQVGQYLMTLPQHLEPFLLRENPAVGIALKACGITGEGEAAELLLGSVASTTCQTFCDHALIIENVTISGAKQLAADITYLGNVLEDLGLSLSESLRQACLLLRTAPENYHEVSIGCSPRLVASIRHMRNLASRS